MAEIESIDEIMSWMLSGTFNYNHNNPLILEIGNYKIQDLHSEYNAAYPSTFYQLIHIVSEHDQVSRI